MPFKTKICGITTPEDGLMVADAGVDAIGLNFFEGSKRFIDARAGSEIVRRLPRNVKRVGVFVNASNERIRQIAEELELDYVQLHGDEPPEFLSLLTGLAVIRAFRCKNALEEVADFLSACRQPPVAVLVDAYDPNEYGGTGKPLHWPDLQNAEQFVGDLPLIIAGGLTPSNVGQAIGVARPSAVDTASGVEDGEPRRKNYDLSRAFVANANRAFATLA